MTFLWPWTFVALMPVAAVAAWVLFRPRRRVAVVGTLALWQRALDALDTASRRRTRRVTAAWVALLAGAVAAVLAGAGPEYHATAPARRVAVAVHPSAELGKRGLEEMRTAVAGLLDRLGPKGRVQLVLPTVAGGAGRWGAVAWSAFVSDGVPHHRQQERLVAPLAGGQPPHGLRRDHAVPRPEDVDVLVEGPPQVDAEAPARRQLARAGAKLAPHGGLAEGITFLS